MLHKGKLFCVAGTCIVLYEVYILHIILKQAKQRGHFVSFVISIYSALVVELTELSLIQNGDPCVPTSAFTMGQFGLNPTNAGLPQCCTHRASR